MESDKIAISQSLAIQSVVFGPASLGAGFKSADSHRLSRGPEMYKLSCKRWGPQTHSHQSLQVSQELQVTGVHFPVSLQMKIFLQITV